MLDLLISVGILLICCCLLLPSYIESISQKNDYRMEEVALNRLFEYLNDWHSNGNPLFIGRSTIEGFTVTFYLEGDVYFATYTDTKNDVQKVFEKLPK